MPRSHSLNFATHCCVPGPEPGLTRDAIKAPTAWRGMTLELTDTAGWMKKARLDQYDDVGGNVAAMTLSQGKRALAAVQVVALLLDAQRLSELGQVSHCWSVAVGQLMQNRSITGKRP